MAKPTAFENWLLLGLLAIGLGVTLGPIVWGHFSRSALQGSGLPAQAVVVALTDTGRRHNSNPVVRVQLKLTTPDGGQRPVEVTLPLSAVRITKLGPGTVVPVRVDPRDPGHVALAED